MPEKGKVAKTVRGRKAVAKAIAKTWGRPRKMVSEIDLDRLERQRIKELRDSNPPGTRHLESKIFTGERVLSTLKQPKIVLLGYQLPKLLPLLPYCPIVYVQICPTCLDDREELDSFTTFVRHGLIMPLLTGRYADYPAPVIEALRQHDHVSAYEFHMYRQYSLVHQTDRSLCQDCFSKAKADILSSIGRSKSASEYRWLADGAMRALYPRFHPDEEIVALIRKAVADKNLEKLRPLRSIASAVHSLRTAQAWHGATAFSASDLAPLPEGLGKDIDIARHLGVTLKDTVARGLGLQIPTDIPLDRYVEIVKDYQPKISRIIEGLTLRPNGVCHSYEAVAREVSNINGEIRRIKGLRRLMVLHAVAEPLRNNKALVLSGLFAGVLGVGGNMVGCAAAATLGVGAKATQRSGLAKFLTHQIKQNHALAKLGKQIRDDVQPLVLRMLARYVKSNVPAVTVMAVQEGLREAVSSNAA